MGRIQFSEGSNLPAEADRRQAEESAAATASASRGKAFLTRLLEAVASGLPDVCPDNYAEFRLKIEQLAQQVTDKASDVQQTATVEVCVHELRKYRSAMDMELRAQRRNWMRLVKLCYAEALAGRGMSVDSPGAAQLVAQIGSIQRANEIEDLQDRIQGFLKVNKVPSGEAKVTVPVAATADISNDNASGLRGAGLAVAHVQSIIDRSGSGHIALIRLSCLDMIEERFGAESVADCMMAVSAFITSSLHRDDAVYHWEDKALMAILQPRASERILAAELQHISSHNRDITLQVQGRDILLRVPLLFDLTSIPNLKSATDLYKLAVKEEREP